MSELRVPTVDRIDLTQASPDELVRGYGKALADILSRLVAELDAGPEAT